MKVAVDMSITEVTGGGSTVYATETLAALRNVASQHEYLELKYRPRFRRTARLGRKLDTLYRELVWQQARLPVLARRHGAEVIFAPAFLGPAHSRIPVVVSILDVYVYREPKAFPGWQSHVMRRVLPKIVRRAKRIIALSEFGKREILDVFTGIAPEKIAVTYPGVHSRFRVLAPDEAQPLRERYGLQRPFLLSVCTLEPRKNLPRLLEAYAHIHEAIPHDLVLVGPFGWKSTDLFRKIAELNLGDRIRTLGHVPLEDLPGIYNLADVFAFPSLYEGFGLPVLEAMACGCPVVTSDGSSLTELVEHAGIRVDPRSVEAIAGAVLALADDPVLRAEYRRRGLDRATLFTWEACARATAQILQEAAG